MLPIDTERILKIPINAVGGVDERVWTASDDVVFRVRDAYSLALNSENRASCSSGHDPMWHKLWKLKISPKAKTFLWRAAWTYSLME